MERHPFENINISLLDIAKAVGSLVLELPKLHLLSPVSDHFQENRGGAPMLDRELYEQAELDFLRVFHGEE